MAKTNNIGSFNEDIFVFGGVYSNLQALRTVKALAEERGFRPKQIICTGDIIAYCANPVECVDLLEDWGVHAIAGNVELNLRDESDDCGCNFNEGSRCDVFSRQWYPYAKEAITDKNKAYIHSLPEFLDLDFHGKKVKIVHGSYHNISEFVFQSSPDELFDKNFEDSGAEIIVAGHCGIPFERKTKKGHWINAGVIGMPANDGTARTWCGILGLTQNKPSFEFIELNYDHATASKRMLEAGLPSSYANTLINGIWDNCEILPPEETALQGKKLVF